MFDEELVKSTLTPLGAILGSILGLIGTLLGIWNLWLTRKSHNISVKIGVSCLRENNVEKIDGVDTTFSTARRLQITISNNSYFPVTVTETGLVLRTSFWKRRHFTLQRDWRDKSPSQRIEARDIYTFVFHVSSNGVHDRTWICYVFENDPTLETAVAAYAVLATGHRFYGGRKEVRQIVIEMREAIKSIREWIDVRRKLT